MTTGAESESVCRSPQSLGSRLWREARLLGAASVICGVACSSEAAPRAQLVVVIDTNVPLVGQIAVQPDLSLSASLDTVRVDVLDPQGGVVDFLDVVAPEASDWPISFGIAREQAATGRAVKLRVRSFRGALAHAGELSGTTTLEPRPEVTIDRLVDLTLPESGIETARIVLDGECLGRPAVFLEPKKTCISAANLAGDPSIGIEKLAETPRTTAVGSWAAARAVPCHGAPRAGAICIAGGFSTLGDPDAVGLDPVYVGTATPLVPALLSPFWMDETEYTVGRFRQLLERGGFDGQLPFEAAPGDQTRDYCSYLGATVADNDALGLSCIIWESARRVCQLEGGDLPSEAQWEHAARGRGELRRYPWGDVSADCCVASVSRRSSVKAPVICDAAGPEPVGSHPKSGACGGLGDVSRDDVLDLGGGLAEFTLDAFQDFGGPCWSTPGIRRDPVCVDEKILSRIMRGGEWSAGPSIALSALRRRSLDEEAGVYLGFRCVYPDGP